MDIFSVDACYHSIEHHMDQDRATPRDIWAYGCRCHHADIGATQRRFKQGHSNNNNTHTHNKKKKHSGTEPYPSPGLRPLRRNGLERGVPHQRRGPSAHHVQERGGATGCVAGERVCSRKLVCNRAVLEYILQTRIVCTWVLCSDFLNLRMVIGLRTQL